MAENVTTLPKTRPTKFEDMTKEQIRQAIRKKRECNANAQEIVKSLLEKCVTGEYLLKCLPDINQSHFEDVIEERSISQLCGYPLCPKNLNVKDIPKQKYKISLKSNKVYDITARKSFCSNLCYKSAMHIKNQMLTSPLWFREFDDIPEFHLPPPDIVGAPGQEVELAIVKKIDVGIVSSLTNDFASACLNEIKASSTTETSQEFQKDFVTKNVKQTPSTSIKNKNIESQTNTSRMVTKQPSKPVSNPMNIVGDIIEKPEKIVDPILTQTPDQKARGSPKKHLPKKQHSITILTVQVEKCLAEWFTLDTMLFLFGEEKVREMVVDKGKCIKEYLNNYAKGIFYNSNRYDQYQLLCKKLNMLELEDRKYDAQTSQKELKPLPDYSIIKEESKKMQLKLNAFLVGNLEVPEMVENYSVSSKNDEGPLTQLPLVDKNAQNALRRRIVCQHIDKVLPDLLRSLGLLTLSVSSDVRLLVNTFKLKPNNIMFKPIQWTLIVLVIMKLLSLREHRLEYLLQQPLAFKHMQLLLLSYKQDGGYLDRLISWLTDVDRLLDANDKPLMIE